MIRKPKFARLRSYQEDLDFINIECAKKKMSQPEFIQALLKIYKANWKAVSKQESIENMRKAIAADKKRYN